MKSALALAGYISLLLLPVASAVAAQQRVTVAAVVTADARVRVVRPKHDTVAARPGLRLAAGDEVLVPPGSRVDLLFRDGRLERLASSLRLAAPEEEATSGSALLHALATDRVRPARVRPLAGFAVPISPVNGITVVAVRPAFSWHPLQPGATYEVQLRRVGDSTYTRIQAGVDTVLTLGAERAPLLPGEEYEWTVLPGGDGRVAPPMRFRVISAAEYAFLASLPAAAESAGLDGVGRSVLEIIAWDALGLAYEALGGIRRLRLSGGDPLPPGVDEIEQRLLVLAGRSPALDGR